MTDKIQKLIDFLEKDISDRKGLGDEWESIDDDVKEDLIQEWKKEFRKILES